MLAYEADDRDSVADEEEPVNVRLKDYGLGLDLGEEVVAL